ncbi:hypothetical protein JHN51_27120, partial [Streptomyces sp. MBT61]
MFGVVAVAAYAANSVQAGASWCTHSTRASDPSTASAVAGTATRACPKRSTSRAVKGATTAVAARPVAVTAPARAYEPRDPAIMMTALTLSMPIGSRAIRLPAVKARAPGVASSRRYGFDDGSPRRRPALVGAERGAATNCPPDTARRGVTGGAGARSGRVCRAGRGTATGR